MSLARAGDHRGPRGGTHQERGRPRLRRLAVLGPAAGPALRGRGRGGLPAALAAATHQPARGPAAVEDQIVRLRKELTKQGLDAGADTIRSHLAAHRGRRPPVPAVSTIWRILSRRGFVTPQPQKRPRSSWHRFAPTSPTNAGRPTSPTGGSPTAPRWRSSTSSTTTPGSPSPRPTAAPSPARRVATFRDRLPRWGIPARVLTDNGAVFTGRQRGGAGSPSRSSSDASGSGSTTPGPTTPRPAARSNGSIRPRRSGSPPNHRPPTIAGLQRSWTGSGATTTPSARTGPSNRRTPGRGLHRPTQSRPDRPVHHRRTAGSVTTASTRPAASPSATTAGSTTSASARRLAGTRVTLLIDDLHIRVIDRDTGELIRELTLDPTRDYQPRGLPPGPPPKQA